MGSPSDVKCVDEATFRPASARSHSWRLRAERATRWRDSYEAVCRWDLGKSLRLTAAYEIDRSRGRLSNERDASGGRNGEKMTQRQLAAPEVDRR